ncbi:NACHT domain-containing protein [Ancylothrix sp. C2]|uniref:NACHT domain-containing protein n=1 Tax=Ancylothrix sp. D3o TaxID=2953691 RepID=UPI0021BA9B08|nr:NACHT domain-containing protein [Ancylothrix sp. D3o]MCT7949794.1 NACHT domain-containing protein [Ancylothrix sp. D3o]
MSSKPSAKGSRLDLLTAIEQEITQRLQQTLHNAVLKTLLQEDPPKQTLRPDIDVKIAKQPRYELPPAANITTVFDQAEGRMLILGAPGSGKTTLLLDLANELCRRAFADDSAAVPVLFDLMGWREDQPLASWLVSELNAKYKLPTNQGWQWLESGKLLLLLDGLNELEDRQEKCILAINHFVENSSYSIPIAVSTRFKEYKSCNARLRLKAAILLRPLNETQIRAYLINARSRELWHNIETEPNLLELAKTPLLLNMMTLAYEEILIHSWKRLTEKEEMRQYLFNAYIRRQLSRQINSRKQPTPEKVRFGLIWLAKQMEKNHQSEFGLDNIPVSWLPPATKAKINLIALPVLKNLVLRIILWQKGYIPWNYRKFLDYVSQQFLMQKVGRRYRFQHKLLQEHFSQMAD